MSASLDAVAWPASRAGEALEALAAHVGMRTRAIEVPPMPEDILRGIGPHDDKAGAWIEQAAAWLGLEAEPVQATWPQVPDLLLDAAPALVVLPPTKTSAPRVVALCARATWRRDRAFALGPDLRRHAVPLEPLRAALCVYAESGFLEHVRGLLARIGIAPSRRAKAERALLAERLGAVPVRGAWLLRQDPGDDFVPQLRQAGVLRRLGAMLATQLGLYALAGLAWAILGRSALQGTLDRAWLLGWALALVTTIPLQLLVAWNGGRLALDVGTLFKQRLLVGAIRLDPETVRHEGAGAMLGRVIESSAVEANALTGATTSIAAVPELALAAGTLALGVGGPLQAAVYVGWVLFGVAVAARYSAVRRRWTVGRVAMTNDMVERMVGHRTRAAQERPERWHDGEDKALEQYIDASASLDRAQAVLTVLLPRGWTLLGVASLAPALTTAGASPLALAVGVGAVLFAGHALRSVTGGLVSLLSAGIAWREVAPLFRAAAVRDEVSASLVPMKDEEPSPVDDAPTRVMGRAVVEAHDLVFRHAGRAEPVLKGISLRVAQGDRVLLEGSSGSGKSTLGALLAGLRTPTSGLLLLHGLDPKSVGPTAWRRRVVAAPQFHENHIMTGTLAFNLLFGRRWPATEDDLAEADAVCRELELGSLLERMPSGLQQMVGESGWSLSHGEKSRIYMARALLQGAELVVLDESLAALDPNTLKKALACAFRRSPALLVIAHP